MEPKTQAYFSISGEALLDMLKIFSDLPEDAKLVKLMADPGPQFFDISNTARFLITSKEFREIHEGECVTRIELKMKETLR